MQDRLEALLKQFEGMKGYIDKGNTELKSAYEGVKTELAMALAHNDEMKTHYDGVLKKNEELESRVKYMENVFGKSNKTITISGLEEEKSKFSILRAMYAIHTDDWSGAGFEKEVFENARKAVEGQREGDNEAGGYLIPTEVSQDIIELLRPESIAIALGVTTLSDLSGGEWQIPAGKGGIQTYWVGENLPLTESEELFGQVSLRPKEIGALVRMSLRFAKRARPDAETYIRGRLAQELALAIDKAVFMGTGGQFQPQGLWNTGGLSEFAIDPQGGNGGDFDLEHIVDLEGKLEDVNALVPGCQLAMHPKIKRKLKKTRIAQFSTDTGGEYVFKGFKDSDLADFLGYAFKTTTQLPTNLVVGSATNVSPMFFANWRDVLLGQWGNFEIAVATQAGTSFEKRQMLMRITQEVDVGVARKDSVCVVTDAKTA